jgi:hypothetical protein
MASVERRSASRRPKVRYTLGNRECSGDLVFQAGRPVLVISWRTLDWKRIPYICCPLDAAKLKVSGRPGVYVYEGDLTSGVEKANPAVTTDSPAERGTAP